MVVSLILATQALRPPALVLEGAKLQLANPAQYTQEYFSIPYPGGDPPADKGACTDVVVRALRHAGHDLQQLVHEDARRVSYPRIRKRDRNIDHRRCPNLVRFFSRFGRAAPLDRDFRPGDVVFWKLPGGLDHVGVVSDTVVGDRPKVIHNIWQTAEEDVLNKWPVVGHFRYPV